MSAVFTLGLALAPAVANAGFTGGLSLRVSPNYRIDIRWIADFVGSGKVEVFDNPDGTGSPIDSAGTVMPANDQTITFNVGGLIKADTTYYFKVTHSDGIRPDLTNGSPPYPLFLTGAQVISNVFVEADFESAVLSWDTNVIGYGSVVHGVTGLDHGPVEDSFNITRSSSTRTRMAPAASYCATSARRSHRVTTPWSTSRSRSARAPPATG